MAMALPHLANSNAAHGLAEEFYQRSWLGQNFLHWLREQGVDPAFVFNMAGPISEHAVIIRGRNFRFADAEVGSTSAVVQVAYGDDAETPVDLIAWRRSRPQRIYQYLGNVEAIGVDQIQNPATWFLNKPLYVHASPLEWLRAKCAGIIVVDFAAVRARLARLPVRAEGRALAVNTLEFGRNLRSRLAPLPDQLSILAPELWRGGWQ